MLLFLFYYLIGDYMNIYYEEVLILNFLLDFMILYGTKRILKINVCIFRLIIGSIVGSLTTFLLLIDISNFNLFIIKILLSIIIITISFGYKNILVNTFYFYIISIIIGGVFYLFELDNNIYIIHIILVIGSFIIIKLLVYELLKYKEKYINKYIVDIYFNNKKYKLEGFIDTGNRLISKKGENIILTNLSINTNKFIFVPYKALNTTGIIKCIRPDKVIINNKNINNCLIGLSKDKFSIEEDCILPNKLKEELC